MTKNAEKVAVITGASKGLGLGLATFFASKGIKVAGISRTKPKNESENINHYKGDVTDHKTLKNIAEEIDNDLGPIDIWINNAGVLGPIQPFRNIDPDEFKNHININLFGVMNGSSVFINHRRQRKSSGGTLINISSGAARNAYEGWSAYCSGKSAVDRLTEVIALEEKESGLKCHSVAPGIIDTRMQAEIRATTKENFPSLDKFLELKEKDAFSSAEFVAQKMLDLCSSQSVDFPVCVSFPLEHE